MLPVAGYYRISKGRDEMSAPELYRTEIERYCAYKQLDLAEIYEDIDRSAFRGAAERPGLNRMIEDRRKYSAVIVPKLSRLGRSMSELIKLFDLFDSDGVALVFLDNQIDTSTSQGRLLRHVMSAFAEYESDVKSDYSRANYRMASQRGEPGGGGVPIGYRRVNKRWEVDEEAAVTVRHMFELALAGRSFIDIAVQLNTNGVPTATGSIWRQQSVARVLKNPSYAALRKLDGEWFPMGWDPLVSVETWRRVQELFVQRRLNHPGYRWGKYVLSGLVYCGVCGRRLLHGRMKERHIFVCRGQMEMGVRCSGGYVGRLRAESFVSEALFERFPSCKAGSEQVSSTREIWDGCSVIIRRELLTSLLERIVLVPRFPGAANRWSPRDLSIEWRKAVPLGEPLDLTPLSAPLPVPVRPSKACVRCQRILSADAFHNHRDGRSTLCAQCVAEVKTLRVMGVAAPGKRKSDFQQSQKSRAYFQEWGAWRRAHRPTLRGQAAAAEKKSTGS